MAREKELNIHFSSFFPPDLKAFCGFETHSRVVYRVTSHYNKLINLV